MPFDPTSKSPPILIFVYAVGDPPVLIFTLFGVAAMMMSVLIVKFAAMDGESRSMGGIMLVCLCIILAIE